jgi:hypothetical protein
MAMRGLSRTFGRVTGARAVPKEKRSTTVRCVFSKFFFLKEWKKSPPDP